LSYSERISKEEAMSLEVAEESRDVLYRIGVQAHPGTKSVLQELGRETTATQDKMVGAARSVADSCLAEVKRMREGIARGAIPVARTTAPSTWPPSRPTVPASVRPDLANPASARRSPPLPEPQAQRAVSVSGESVAAVKAQVAEEIGLRKKAAEEAADASKKYRDARLAAIKKAHEARVKMELDAAARVHAIRQRAQAKVQALLERGAQQQAQVAERREYEAKAAYETAKARAQGLREQTKQYQAAAVEAFGSVGESVMRMSRGLVALKLVNEETTETMLRGLVKMQGIFDTVIGGANALMRTYKAFDVVAKLMETRRAASAAAATAASRAADLNAAALAREAAAAKLAAVVHRELNDARGGSGGASPGKESLTEQARDQAMSLAEEGRDKLVDSAKEKLLDKGSTVVAGGVGGAGAAGAGLAAKSVGGMAVGGSATTVAGAGLAAIAGLTAATTTLVSVGRQISEGGWKTGLTKGKAGTATDWVAQKEVSVLAFLEKNTRALGGFREAVVGVADVMRTWESVIAGGANSQKSTLSIVRSLNESYAKLDRMIARTAKREEHKRKAAEEQVLKGELYRRKEAIWDQQLARKQKLAAITSPQTPQQKQTSLQQREAHHQSRLDHAANLMDKAARRVVRLRREGAWDTKKYAQAEAEFADMKRFLGEQLEKQVGLGEERLRIEQRISEETKKRHVETAQSLQKELGLIRDRVRAERKRYLTDKERFGALAPEKQKQVIAAKEEVQDAGLRALSPEMRLRRAQILQKLNERGGLSQRLEDEFRTIQAKPVFSGEMQRRKKKLADKELDLNLQNQLSRKERSELDYLRSVSRRARTPTEEKRLKQLRTMREARPQLTETDKRDWAMIQRTMTQAGAGIVESRQQDERQRFGELAQSMTSSFEKELSRHQKTVADIKEERHGLQADYRTLPGEERIRRARMRKELEDREKAEEERFGRVRQQYTRRAVGLQGRYATAMKQTKENDPLALLGLAGDRMSSEMVREARLQQADREGYDQAGFGLGSQFNNRLLQGIEGELKVKLEDNRKIVVDLDASTKARGEEIAHRVAAVLNANFDRMIHNAINEYNQKVKQQAERGEVPETDETRIAVPGW